MKKAFVRAGVSCFGLGFLKRGSGTLASAVAVPFWWGLASIASMAMVSGVLLVIAVVGVFLTQAYGKMGGEEDASEIVIDEWVGMGIAMLPVVQSPWFILVAFVLFRVFDIWKPPGVRYFDRNYLEGWGVMLDDVVAGVYAAILTFGLYRFI